MPFTNPYPRAYAYGVAAEGEVCIGEGFNPDDDHPLTAGQEVVRRMKEPFHVYCLDHKPWPE